MKTDSKEKGEENELISWIMMGQSYCNQHHECDDINPITGDIENLKRRQRPLKEDNFRESVVFIKMKPNN